MMLDLSIAYDRSGLANQEEYTTGFVYETRTYLPDEYDWVLFTSSERVDDLKGDGTKHISEIIGDPNVFVQNMIKDAMRGAKDDLPLEDKPIEQPIMRCSYNNGGGK